MGTQKLPCKLALVFFSCMRENGQGSDDGAQQTSSGMSRGLSLAFQADVGTFRGLFQVTLGSCVNVMGPKNVHVKNMVPYTFLKRVKGATTVPGKLPAE